MAHAGCIVCGATNRRGLGLKFVVDEDGSVRAEFCCSDTLQGYPTYLHGGVVASLLDGAMANCLFAHGQIALTAELKVRFLHPVLIAEAGIVRAWIDRSHSSLQILQAEVIQGGKIKATALGKFMRQSTPHLPG
jgi:uncharacterized protein (TIGR00369 family)